MQQVKIPFQLWGQTLDIYHQATSARLTAPNTDKDAGQLNMVGRSVRQNSRSGKTICKRIITTLGSNSLTPRYSLRQKSTRGLEPMSHPFRFQETQVLTWKEQQRQHLRSAPQVCSTTCLKWGKNTLTHWKYIQWAHIQNWNRATSLHTTEKQVKKSFMFSFCSIKGFICAWLALMNLEGTEEQLLEHSELRRVTNHTKPPTGQPGVRLKEGFTLLASWVFRADASSMLAFAAQLLTRISKASHPMLFYGPHAMSCVRVQQISNNWTPVSKTSFSLRSTLWFICHLPN